MTSGPKAAPKVSGRDFGPASLNANSHRLRTLSAINTGSECFEKQPANETVRAVDQTADSTDVFKFVCEEVWTWIWLHPLR